MAEKEEFVISKGVLTWYGGPGGDVVIPDGVTKIRNRAFFGDALALSLKPISEPKRPLYI